MKKILKPVLQLYANYLLLNLEKCSNLFEYELIINNAVLLDFIAIEHFNISLD